MANRKWFLICIIIFGFFVIKPVTLEQLMSLGNDHLQFHTWVHHWGGNHVPGNNKSLVNDNKNLSKPFKNNSVDDFVSSIFPKSILDEIPLTQNFSFSTSHSSSNNTTDECAPNFFERWFFAKFSYSVKQTKYQFYTFKLEGESTELPEDFSLTPQLIEMNGYRCEQYTVLTEDGYRLKAYRITNQSDETISRPPVILQHGFIGASDIFLLQNQSSSAFLLAQAGFDVWMTDLRGNWYSREHTKYLRSDPEYWDFSFHESGYYDLPAFIDKVLNVTGESQVFYIGHSMGTTIFLVMASLRPDYNEKIKAAVLMAPISITPPLKNLPIHLRTIIKFADKLYNACVKFGISQLMPRTYTNIIVTRKFGKSYFAKHLCLYLLRFIFQEKSENLDKNRIANQLSYVPAGTSLRTAHHLSQIYRKGFRHYDFGPEKNTMLYGSEEAPLYSLSNVTAPVALYWGANDMFISEESVNELASQLKNVIKNHKIVDPDFTHIDFVYGVHSKEVLYSDVIDLLKSLSTEEINEN